MKCPKCQYIGFDDGNRCRNCGYEFSLTPTELPLDLAIDQDQPPPGRMVELSLHDDEPTTGREAPPPERPPGAKRPLTAGDLPLFIERVADDQAPLVAPPAVPRAPLSVRRAPPARPIARPGPPDELPLDAPPPRTERRSEAREGSARRELEDTGGVAGVQQRATAGLIDLAILGAVSITVVYLTLRLTQLAVDDLERLPLAPIVAFLLLFSGGYFVLFTVAGGQTIGKMLTRIRVVPGSGPGGERGRVPFATASLRSVALLGSVAALGAGFVPVLLSADRRAFHDRVADTRVVLA